MNNTTSTISNIFICLCHFLIENESLVLIKKILFIIVFIIHSFLLILTKQVQIYDSITYTLSGVVSNLFVKILFRFIKRIHTFLFKKLHNLEVGFEGHI